MTVVSTGRSTRDEHHKVARFVLVGAGPHGELVLLRQRRRDAVFARLRHRHLDDRLAAGVPPESSRLLASRAAQLLGDRLRRRLARRWDDLALHPRLSRAPSPRSWTDLAEDFRHLALALRADQLVVARGVAIAAAMLDSARGAVSRLASGGDDIAGAIARAAITAMGHQQQACAPCRRNAAGR